jgi:hypothetical protein
LTWTHFSRRTKEAVIDIPILQW